MASLLLSELQRLNAGRVTFMPLNQLRRQLGADLHYPDTPDAVVSSQAFPPTLNTPSPHGLISSKGRHLLAPPLLASLPLASRPN